MFKTFDRLRSLHGLESVSTPQIGIHWHHYLKSRPNLRIFSNLLPFQILWSMANLLVRVRVYVSDVDLRKWETAIDLRIWNRNQTWIWGLDVDLSLTGLQKHKNFLVIIIYNKKKKHIILFYQLLRNIYMYVRLDVFK